jgi:hypothetical protein
MTRFNVPELINEKHADLLLFGYVSDPGKAVVIYAVNEHGGCDDPKPTDIKQGALGSDFTTEEKEKLIAVSLQEIQSACRNQSSINWELFAKRIIKMENILNAFQMYQAKYSPIFSSYIDAMRFLYSHDEGDNWFVKGKIFLNLQSTSINRMIRVLARLFALTRIYYGQSLKKHAIAKMRAPRFRPTTRP